MDTETFNLYRLLFSSEPENVKLALTINTSTRTIRWLAELCETDVPAGTRPNCRLISRTVRLSLHEAWTAYQAAEGYCGWSYGDYLAAVNKVANAVLEIIFWSKQPYEP